MKRKIKVLAVIPARYSSTRLPGKPLALINDKPMIQWVYESAKKCPFIDRVIVATDDVRIFDIVKNFGGEAMMTSPNHKSGSDRVAEVAKKVSSDIVINVQGDEPMITPKILSKIIQEFYKDKYVNVVTPICKLEYISELFNPNFVKVVVDKNGFAMYFSRSIIPFIRDNFDLQKQNFVIKDNNFIDKGIFFRHIGIYGYRRNFLFKFLSLPQGKLEKLEKLEQLRILEHGYKIKTILVEDSPVSVDTSEDLERVRRIFSKKYENNRNR